MIDVSSGDDGRGGSDPRLCDIDGDCDGPLRVSTEDASVRKSSDQEAENHRADLAEIASMRNMGRRYSESPNINEPRERGWLSPPVNSTEVDATTEPPAEDAGQSGEVRNCKQYVCVTGFVCIDFVCRLVPPTW